MPGGRWGYEEPSRAFTGGGAAGGALGSPAVVVCFVQTMHGTTVGWWWRVQASGLCPHHAAADARVAAVNELTRAGVGRAGGQ